MRRGFRSPRHQTDAAAEPVDAFTTALRLLSRRELSIAELRQRLADRQVPRAETERTIERLIEDGTLNDRRAAAAIARTHAAVKGRGRLRVARELTARGVDEDTARAALDEVFGEIAEADLLERALRRRLRTGRITDQAQFRRLYAYLSRLGFASNAIVKLLKKHSKVDIEF
jgi:regulatory protein